MSRWPTKQTAIVGAIVGAGAGLLLLSGVDPSDSTANDSYRSGQKAGYVARYAALGALATVLAARILRPDEGTRNRTVGLYLLGFLAVLCLAVLPPVLDEESPSERRAAEAVRADDSRAEFRAGAINGCVDGVRRRLEGQADTGLNADAYCVCMIDRLMREGSRRGVALDTLAGQIQAGGGPPWAQQAGAACVERAVR